jgi:hypothetical protein
MPNSVTYQVQTFQRKSSDLFMVLIPDVPGFILHAYSQDEIEEKLAGAFEAYMNATGRPVSGVEVVRNETMKDYWPPAYVAKAVLTAAGA